MARGFPATSPWWKKRVRSFLEGTKRRGVWRVGRRGGKSSTLCRLALVIALYGEHVIPPGDMGIIGVVSVTKGEARNRVRTLQAILDALGYEYAPIDGGIRILGTPYAAQCFAATLGGVVGGTWVVALFDEVARWKDSDTGVNPATQVLASARPTMATQRNARELMCSSPLGEFDAHYDAMREGDTPAQDTYEAPTWEANPTITEDETRHLETDDAIWRREYAAIPSAEVEEGLLTVHDVETATRRTPEVLPPAPGHTYVATMDPATRGNAWTFAIGTADDTGRTVVAKVLEWQGTQAAPLSPRATLKLIAAECAPYGIRDVYTDQHAGDELAEIAREFGIELIIQPWTSANKLAACQNLRTLVRSGGLELPPVHAVRTDLLGIRMRITRTGISPDFPHVGARHCDYAPTIAKLASLHIAPPTHAHEQSDEQRMKEERRKRALEQQTAPWHVRALRR